MLVPEGFRYRPLSVTDINNIKNSFWTNDGILYDVSSETLSTNYLFICVHYGNPAPCPESIFDKEVNSCVQNVRTINQIEMKCQLFVLYDFKNCILYCSNSKKRRF